MYSENSLLLNGFDVRQLIVGQARTAVLSASHYSSVNIHSNSHQSWTSQCDFSEELEVLAQKESKCVCVSILSFSSDDPCLVRKEQTG